MNITIRKFDNGNTSASMDTITVSHVGATIVSEKTIEVIDTVAKDYFKNPEKYIIDFEKGGIHAKSTTA